MIILIGSEAQLNEFTNGKSLQGVEQFSNMEAIRKAVDTGVVIDLSYEPSHLQMLKEQKGLVMVNCVEQTLDELDPSFVRFNGWPGFLNKGLIEAAAKENSRAKAEETFEAFEKKIQWVPDRPGLVAPRVIASILYEAMLTWKEGVSSREEIDIAMKLGTNYPYGPFEWIELIGEEKVSRLWKELKRV